MARCAYCNATILFGGRTVGDHQYCSSHHALLGRAMLGGESQSDLAGVRELIRELREDMLALADEVQQQRASVTEAYERLDFVERALAQLRESGLKRD